MLSDDTKRPTYHDGQYLTPADFIAEDRYHTGLRHRLSLGQHTWGIFAGLELLETPREGSTTSVDVFVSPGFATDGFGREILAFSPYKLDASLFLQPTLPAGWIPVWIRYFTESTDPPRYGYELCDDPDLATRTRETFKIEVGDRPKPYGDVVIGGNPVLETDLDVVDGSIPYQALPEDADDDRWLVPLGYVNWDGASGFVKSTTKDDDDQRVKGRVYGGDVAAHTYPPGDTWELASRRLPPAGDPAARAHGFVRGDLTVEDLLVVLDRGLEIDGVEHKGLELHGSPLTFLDKDGADQKRPIALSRTDQVDSADLHLEIGSSSDGKNRLLIDAEKPERMVVYDNGNVDVAGDLKVKGVVDLSGATGDRIVLGGTSGQDDATAIGSESGGDLLFARAKTAHRWYIDKKPDGGTSSRMWLDGSQLSVRGNALVGAGADGALKTRHVRGKDYQSDSDDDLYLNWNTGHDVHIGNPNQQAGLQLHGSAVIGAGSNGRLRTRHIDGKRADGDALDDLYLQWDTGKDVVIGRNATNADLIVNGGIYIGATKLPVAIDVQAGTTYLGVGGGTFTGFANVTVTSVFAAVSRATLLPSLADIRNVSTANDARWGIYTIGGATPLGGNQYRFLVQWVVGDSDGYLDSISWVAIFVP